MPQSALCCGQGYQEAGPDSKRWVPTPADLPGLEGTPAEHLQYDEPDGCQRRDFRCATIAHYSLFDAIHRARMKASPSANPSGHAVRMRSVCRTAARPRPRWRLPTIKLDALKSIQRLLTFSRDAC